ETTGPEIERDLDGKIDALVAGVGTGGTLTGISRYLRERGIAFQTVAVEPDRSAVLSGEAPGSHGIQGIGGGFIPKALDVSLIDEIIRVRDEDAYASARRFAATESILVGISSGAALHAMIELAKRPEYCGKNIVGVLPDHGDRYLSAGLFED
ncbi:MAG: pyridoxal-phosphate dependent enzyme, partial [Solobacterium sp.]|nr:pyridoxal-phosphate dependent enzyme [Solobacterium sp.]